MKHEAGGRGEPVRWALQARRQLEDVCRFLDWFDGPEEARAAAYRYAAVLDRLLERFDLLVLRLPAYPKHVSAPWPREGLHMFLARLEFTNHPSDELVELIAWGSQVARLRAGRLNTGRLYIFRADVNKRRADHRVCLRETGQAPDSLEALRPTGSVRHLQGGSK